MVNTSGPSFIPKQPASGKLKQRKTRQIYVLSYVSFVVFFGTLIAAGGTFFLNYSTEKQLEAEKQTLADLRNGFNQADFERIKALDQQLMLAESLLARQVSVLSILDALKDNTLKTVKVSGFTVSQTNPGELMVNFAGETDNFNSVLFQREEFENDHVFSNVRMTEFISEPDETDFLSGSDEDERIVRFAVTADMTVENIPFVARQFSAVRNSLNDFGDDAIPDLQFSTSDEGESGDDQSNVIEE